MANTTADIEQLLADLVRITSRIATSINVTQPGASDDSDSLTSTTNRLSLSATIFAVAAFIIAALQAILQYASSDESGRRKCNFAAIGQTSKYVRKKWTFRGWRRKFYYPELNINADAVFGEYSHVTPNKQSNIKVPAQVLQSRPRATWAQLLSMLDYEHGVTEPCTYVDVDSIPSSLDVATQLVNLGTLGELAIHMGCHSVKINVEKRDILALSKFGSLTTEELAGFGRVVRFQSHGISKWTSISDSPKSARVSASRLIRGVFDIGSNWFGKRGLEPDDARSHSVTLWEEDNGYQVEADCMLLALKKSPEIKGRYFPLDPVSEGASTNLRLPAAISQWQKWSLSTENPTKCPSILVTLAVSSLPLSTAGFPRGLLVPFLPQCGSISQVISSRRSVRSMFKLWNIICKERATRGLQEYIVYPRCDPASPQFRTTATELCHWANDNTDIAQHAIWPCHSIEFWWDVILQNMSEEDEADDEPEGRHPVFRSHHVKNSDPPLFVHSLTGHWESGDPGELVKQELISLDFTIHQFLQVLHKANPSSMRFNCFGINSNDIALSDTFAFRAIEAISTAAAEGAGIDSEPFHDLEDVILKRLVAVHPVTALRYKLVQWLADFIRLRVVLYAAYLMLITDSTDVVKALELTNYYSLYMPMI
ncbi:hypothetical protein F4802DRAFT_477945 [Xylaria palmicola]|nr:hypothetical protein F4802DRAFT_477945 [Xylaria palmicola]